MPTRTSMRMMRRMVDNVMCMVLVAVVSRGVTDLAQGYDVRHELLCKETINLV